MNLVIVNLHSALNLGDDAIMYATLPRLKKAFPQARIYLIANDPHSWEKHKDVQVIGSLLTWVIDRQKGSWRPKKVQSICYPFLLIAAAFLYRCFRVRLLFGNPEQRRLLATYYSADLVLSCGGGNYYSNKALLGFGFFWTIMCFAFAVMLGKKSILLPQSVGPIPGKIQRWLTKITFNHAKKIFVRDIQSENLIKEMGVKTDCMILPDLVFSLPSEYNLPQNQLIENHLPLQIGVTVINRGDQLRGFQGQDIYENAIIDALRQIHHHYPVKIHVFSQCFGPSPDQDDRLIAEKVFSGIRSFTDNVYLHNDIRDAIDLQKAYQEMDCMLGSRMHTAILAFVGGVPVVLIGYQPKAQGMMRFFGFEKKVIPIEEVSSERLTEALLHILESRAKHRTYIIQKTEELAKQLSGWEESLR